MALKIALGHLFIGYSKPVIKLAIKSSVSKDIWLVIELMFTSRGEGAVVYT